jgi:hypothetical protein
VINFTKNSIFSTMKNIEAKKIKVWAMKLNESFSILGSNEPMVDQM